MSIKQVIWSMEGCPLFYTQSCFWPRYRPWSNAYTLHCSTRSCQTCLPTAKYIQLTRPCSACSDILCVVLAEAGLGNAVIQKCPKMHTTGALYVRLQLATSMNVLHVVHPSLTKSDCCTATTFLRYFNVHHNTIPINVTHEDFALLLNDACPES